MTNERYWIPTELPDAMVDPLEEWLDDNVKKAVKWSWSKEAISCFVGTQSGNRSALEVVLSGPEDPDSEDFLVATFDLEDLLARFLENHRPVSANAHAQREDLKSQIQNLRDIVSRVTSNASQPYS